MGVESLLPEAAGGFDGLIGWPVAAAGALVALSVLLRRSRAPGFPVLIALAAIGCGWFGVYAVAGLPLNDRYLLVPALALAVLAAESLPLAPRDGVAVVALVLALAGTGAAIESQARAGSQMLRLAAAKHAADRDLERLLARADVRAEARRCGRVTAAGSGRAAVAALLERDPAEVPVSRAPLPQRGEATLGTSNSIAPGTRSAVREGAWTWVSRCGQTAWTSNHGGDR